MTFRGRHRPVKLPRPRTVKLAHLLIVKHKGYIVIGLAVSIEWHVCKVFARWPIPVFTGGVLLRPVLGGGRWFWLSLGKKPLLWAYSNNGFLWTPCWVVISCSKRHWIPCLSFRCSRSCCRSCNWSTCSSWFSGSSSEGASVSASLSELLHGFDSLWSESEPFSGGM